MEMSSRAETKAEAESKEKSVDLGEEGSSKSKRKSKRSIEDEAEIEIELEKWKQVLVGQQFVRDASKSFPGQYEPVDHSILMPENVRYIIVAESGDYDPKRLSVYLDKQFRVRDVRFG